VKTRELFDLSGKVALVTGGRGFYGAPISEGLCEAGAHVIIASRDKAGCDEWAAKLQEAGWSAEGAALDLGSDGSIDALAAMVKERHGAADVLVNASVTRLFYSDPMEAAREQVMESLNINVAGLQMITTRIMADMIEKNKKGSVINIASIQAVRAPHFYIYDEDQSSALGYTMEKHGMVGFTKWLAAFYGKKGIRVNCVSPGGYNPALAQERPEFFARYEKKCPLGRWAEWDDIKGPVVFLASEASRYVTGDNLVMDGGFTIW
jgi:NAD(P)-dependent dehydrogenase (short-subunit alcohol dehydrogenase family)